MIEYRSDRQNLILTLLVFFTYLFILPKQSHNGDMYFWEVWSIFIFENGLGAAYQNPTLNYLPLGQYLFWFFGKLQGSTQAIDLNTYMIKSFPLICDFIAAGILARLMPDRENRWFYFFLLILNPIFLYNSMLWGQLDSIHAMLLFVSCLAAWRGKIILAGVSFILAVNFKLQSIVYLPVIGLLLLPVLFDLTKWKKIVIAIVLMGILQVLIILPFWLEGDLDKMMKVLSGAVDHYPVLSANAFNMWHWLVVEGDPFGVTDKVEYMGITAKLWGLALFFLSSFVLLFPVLLLVVKNFKKGAAANNEGMLEITLLAGAMVTMNFFFFCTQMHERYSHVAMIFVCAYTILKRRWGLLVLFFTAYFLNMEKILRYLEWENYDTFIYDPDFIAALFFIFMLFMYKDLYKKYFALRR